MAINGISYWQIIVGFLVLCFVAFCVATPFIILSRLARNSRELEKQRVELDRIAEQLEPPPMDTANDRTKKDRPPGAS
jgi:hypothetical protein